MSQELSALLRARLDAAALRAGGLSILERQIWTLSRAGFSRVEVRGVSPKTAEGLRLPAGTGVDFSGPGEFSDGRFAVEVSGEHVFRPVFLAGLVRELRENPAASANVEDSHGRWALKIPGSAATGRALAQDVLALPEPFAPSPVLDWLKGCVAKPQDGFMARRFDRHVSWALSRRLLDTPLTPNMMSLASLALGLLGSGLFLSLDLGLRLAGALLVLLHSMLDGCDGEISRAKFLESRLGAQLDFWGDNAVHATLFFCLGAGIFRRRGSWHPLALGALASASALAAAAVFFRRRMAPRWDKSAQWRPDAADLLAGRDFLYALAPLVWLGLGYRFLEAAAVGTPVFFAAVLLSPRA